MEIFFIVLLSAILVLSSTLEGSLLSINKLKTRILLDRREDAENLISFIEKNIDAILSTVIFINILSSLGILALTILFEEKYISFLFSNIYLRILGGFVVSIGIISFLQIIPKLITQTKPSIISIRLIKGLYYFSYIFFLTNKLFIFIARKLSYIFGIPQKAHEPAITEEEIKSIIEIGEEGGMVEESERKMIHGIFDLGDTMVREVMNPRVDMVCINQKSSLADAVELIKANHHSRIPVYKENIDNIVGILYAKDILEYINKEQFNKLITKDVMRPPMFVPETKLIIELLHEFRKSKMHLAIAVDEYGGTSGVVTIEDIIEEVIGEIQDEYDTDEEELYKQSENGYIIDAKMPIAEFKELLNIKENLEDEEDFDTLGGFAFAQFGRIPSIGEIFESHNVCFEVIDADEKRVKTLRITEKPSETMEE